MKQSTTPEVFDRLDQAYALWEEDMWRARLRRRLCQFNNPDYEPKVTEAGFPVDGAHKTKQLLLESVLRGNLDYLLPSFYSKGITERKSISLEELKRIEDLEDPVEKKAAYTVEVEAGARWEEFHFPYYLGKWNSSSRRIYYVPDDLILLLESTSLKGLTFRDIHLPFSSFAIALETPLINGEGKELDFFLIGDFSFQCFALYGFARSLSKVKWVDSSLRANIDEAARRGNARRFMQLTKKELHRISVITEHWESSIHPNAVSEDDLEEDLEKMLSKAEKEDVKDYVTKFFRVFVGLCLYLNSFSNTYSNVTERIPNIKKAYAGAKDGPVLTEAAEVCRVQSIVQLTLKEKEIIRDQLSGRGGWEVRTHFREGFWRRPRGEGHNPLAQKTIWVRPTLVRRDRLPDGALPLGMGKVVLS
ncbi:MAG: hypothetical protein Q8P17_01730 [bacterium]|nr:hypothetical protein [bacterium]